MPALQNVQIDVAADAVDAASVVVLPIDPVVLTWPQRERTKPARAADDLAGIGPGRLVGHIDDRRLAERCLDRAEECLEFGIQLFRRWPLRAIAAELDVDNRRQQRLIARHYGEEVARLIGTRP